MPFPAQGSDSSNDIIINPNTNKIYVYAGDNKSISVIDGKTDEVVKTISLEKSTAAPVNIDPSLVIQILGIAGGIATAIVGLVTYRQGVATTRKDVLKDIIFPLIKDYDESEKIDLATKILDDIPISEERTPPKEDRPYGLYDKKRLLKTLEHHDIKNTKDNWDKGDTKVRESFDTILSFFGRLESLISINLVTKQELNYFHYFIKKAAENEAVVNYVRLYHFQLLGKLNADLDSEKPLIDIGKLYETKEEASPQRKSPI
jgi:hypothetical protein